MKALFLFQLNIPSEYVISGYPDKFVTVKVTELPETGEVYAEFIDLNNNLVTSVKDWLGLWRVAQNKADEKVLEYKNNAIVLGDFKITEDHACQLLNLNS